MDKSFTILHRIIQAAGIRQKVIASNLANVDTPGYKARNVQFDNILNRKLQLLKTRTGHIQHRSVGEVNALISIENELSWGDRNNVELNREVAKMTENALVHNTALKILGSKIKMFKNAISTRR